MKRLLEIRCPPSLPPRHRHHHHRKQSKLNQPVTSPHSACMDRYGMLYSNMCEYAAQSARVPPPPLGKIKSDCAPFAPRPRFFLFYLLHLTLALDRDIQIDKVRFYMASEASNTVGRGAGKIFFTAVGTHRQLLPACQNTSMCASSGTYAVVPQPKSNSDEFTMAWRQA